jgi:hypothetical protein
MSIEAMKQAQDPFGYFQYSIELDAWVQNREKNIGTAFYTVPPKREWINLTNDEITEVDQGIDARSYSMFAYTRAIEAKLREKNT